jgi:hypothetical protein
MRTTPEQCVTAVKAAEMVLSVIVNKCAIEPNIEVLKPIAKRVLQHYHHAEKSLNHSATVGGSALP